MSDSFNALRSRLQSLNNSSKKKNDLWKAKGDHVIRFLPYPHSEDPLVVVYFHYDIGSDGPVYCPKHNDGDDCDVCDFSDKLRAWKTPEGDDKSESDRKTDFEIFKKIQAKASVFAAMVERGKESEGSKFVRLTPKQADELLETCGDSDRLLALGINKDDTRQYTKVLFGETAFDVSVKFTKKGEGSNKTSFDQTVYTPKIMPSPILADKKAVGELLSKIKDIKEVYPPKTAAEVSKIFKKFVGAGLPEAKPEGGREYSPPNSDEKPLTGGRSIEEGLESLNDIKSILG